MKILLLEHPRTVNPERCNDIANTPLSSCLLSGYAAAMLRQEGHEVEIIEGFLDRRSYADITARVAALKPDLLGVHIVYHWKRDDALFDFLARMRAAHAPYVAAYGFYPTIAYEMILQECPDIDAVLLGEPELTFAALARTLAAQGNPLGLRGLAARDAAGAVRSERAELIQDLDALPFPVRTEGLYRISEVNIQGSRGCYGKCTFCYINPFYGNGSRWRSRSPENIIAEIDAVIAAKGKRDFYFTDPNFFGPGQKGQERALRIAALLKPRGIRFGIEGRVNDIHDETIGALAEAGLRHILIGLESGKDDSLKRMNKMTTVEQNERALRILRRHGIEPNVGFIMFEPDSDLHDLRTNFEFLKRNELLKSLPITANVLYHHQIVLKGTPAFRQLAESGRLATASPAAYEGTAAFADPDVQALAGVMRQLTNFLFNRMSDIWSGRTIEPPGARQRYAKVNALLVGAFETTLASLEGGAGLDREAQEALVRKVAAEMDEVLNF